VISQKQQIGHELIRLSSVPHHRPMPDPPLGCIVSPMPYIQRGDRVGFPRPVHLTIRQALAQTIFAEHRCGNALADVSRVICNPRKSAIPPGSSEWCVQGFGRPANMKKITSIMRPSGDLSPPKMVGAGSHIGVAGPCISTT